jgi:hypothetical protein
VTESLVVATVTQNLRICPIDRSHPIAQIARRIKREEHDLESVQVDEDNSSFTVTASDGYTLWISLSNVTADRGLTFAPGWPIDFCKWNNAIELVVE